MRSAVLFLIGWLLGACGTHTPAALPNVPSRVDVAADLESKTVALISRDTEDHTRSFCSGVWVSDTSILTAFHCVEDNESESVEYAVRSDVYAPGELHERPVVTTRLAKIYATDENHDLALLRAFYAPFHRVAHVNLEPVLPGSFAQAMGHSLGLWWSYSSGDVAAVRQMPIAGLDILWIQATTPVSHGNSGGGLFDERGYLIGITHGSFPRGEMLNMFVHGQYVDALLRRQAAL